VPRSNRPKRSKRSEPEELNLGAVRFGSRRTESKRGVVYTVQPTMGQNADEDKSWICPNCHLTITPGVSHLVAWDEVRGVDTRRHFHTTCWSKFQGTLL
jgi:methionine synthase II (cobalamin-independent)